VRGPLPVRSFPSRLDLPATAGKMNCMSTPESTNDVSLDADTQLIAECVAAGRPIPPEVVRRVQERAEQARKELLATHGVQNIGVSIIRELRGELPES
jgi:hypothetical protein